MTTMARQRLQTLMGESGDDAIAAMTGYSPQQLTTLLRIAVQLSERKPGADDVTAISKVFPAIPRQMLQDRVNDIAALPAEQRQRAFIGAVTGEEGVEAGLRLMQDYGRFDIATTLGGRLDDRQAAIDRGFGRKEIPRNEMQPQAQGPRGDLLRSLAAHGQLADPPRHVVGARLADQIDRSSKVLHETPEASLADTVGAAFDLHDARDKAVDYEILSPDEAQLHSWDGPS